MRRLRLTMRKGFTTTEGIILVGMVGMFGLIFLIFRFLWNHGG